ncbi:hypothetical protein AMECASPLE_037175 [Ameca splendens]|uniref:Uncharacterized protein n=1 Tax=Ameca splendens TaxID=208324 RepID=A0ABV0ZHV5_9TELE
MTQLWPISTILALLCRFRHLNVFLLTYMSILDNVCLLQIRQLGESWTHDPKTPLLVPCSSSSSFPNTLVSLRLSLTVTMKFFIDQVPTDWVGSTLRSAFPKEQVDTLHSWLQNHLDKHPLKLTLDRQL